ncbi:hypothetical protein RJ640_013740 [Escallonia rubra]|uniref:Protein kinase domain-containing protein n=1 Tax=Escallonia rubra TaxID=112253 RepID=A0AA88QWQ9_9ASTE|nr:hypothetical protein RJ640_013740 [Escallonia rubra]
MEGLLHLETTQMERSLVKLKVKFLGKLSYPNLVQLLGYCLKEEELLLVYEYVQKRSLESHLFESKNYFKISGDSCNNKSIELIMLKVYVEIMSVFAEDAESIPWDFNAKLLDYGLVKLGQMNSESIISTLVAGDTGYIDFSQKDPEYVATVKLPTYACLVSVSNLGCLFVDLIMRMVA